MQSKAFPYEVERHVLDNGLKVLFVPMPSQGLVAYWSIVRTGSRDEVEPGVTGFAHFFEHMMFRGSERFPGPVYDGIVSGMGADANAFTDDDLTCYHLSFSTEDLPKVIEIEADRFQFLKYNEAEFKTEAGAVYGEYRKGRTNPLFALMEKVQETAFERHTYKHTTIGFEDDIKRMPEQFEYSKTFFKRFYRPSNVIVLVAGDFDLVATLSLIKKNYGGWTDGFRPADVPVEPPQTEQKRVTVEFDGQTLPWLMLSLKGERFLPGDRTMMAATLLGDLLVGETSPLYRKLVLDEQRVDALFSSFAPARDPGLWTVFARVKDAADIHRVEQEMWRAAGDLRSRVVVEQRLADTRSRLKYSFLSGLSTPSEVAGGLARLIAITGDVTCVDEMYRTLDRVTPEDVMAAARQYLEPGSCTVAMMHSKGALLPAKTTVTMNEPVLLPVPQDPNVVFKLWFKVGAQDDPEGKEGLTALTAAMLTDGGTTKRTYEEVLAALYPLAASLSSSVDKEMTVISGEVHRDKAGAFYEHLIDAVTSPRFAGEDFERIRTNTISGLENTLRYSSDEELGKAALYESVFSGTAYQHLVGGTVASLKSLTLDDVRNFYRNCFTRERLVIGLAGAYDEALLERLKGDLSGLASGAEPSAPVISARAIKGREVVLVDKPGQSVAISLGCPIDVQRGSRDYYALWIANSWLGEHRNSVSHLYQVIRELRGMNYGDYSYIECFPGGGGRSMPPTGVGRRRQMFEVWIRPVQTHQAVFALRAALREVERLITSGMSAEDFEKQKGFLKKYALHFAETTSERLGYTIDDRFYGIEDGHLARFRRMMDEITLEQVNAAIRKHLQTDNLVIAMVTPDAGKMKQALVSGAPTPIDYGGIEKPEDLLAEDKEIERHPLDIKADQVRIVPVDQMFQ